MVVVALLMASVAMLSLSFLTVLSSSHKENQSSRENLAALYACEAGLTRAVDALAAGGSGNLGSKQYPQSLGDESYWVTSTDLGSQRIQLEGYGRHDDSTVGVEVVVRRQAQGRFRWAAFGDEDLHMDSNARTDSYDSSVGSYDLQKVNGAGSNAYANAEGDVGSNGNISMDSNIGVYGDANPGPSGTVTGDLDNIMGNTTPMSSTVTFPPISVPSVSVLSSFPSNASVNLPSGSYKYTNLTLGTGRQLTVTGPATIVCTNFRMRSNSNILVNANAGPVKFYVIDDFILNSNTTVRSNDYQPSDIEFNLISDNILDPGIDVNFDEDLVDFDSGSQIYGTIYAPNAEITIDSNFELFGAMIARRVDLNSNCRIHYDETLAFNDNGAPPVYETLCWRLIAQP
jgi:hypothetical protein